MGAQESAPAPTEEEEEAQRARNIKRMDSRMRAKLRGGVHYNMKVVVRGCRGSGKSSLWRRLQH